MIGSDFSDLTLKGLAGQHEGNAPADAQPFDSKPGFVGRRRADHLKAGCRSAKIEARRRASSPHEVAERTQRNDDYRRKEPSVCIHHCDLSRLRTMPARRRSSVAGRPTWNPDRTYW